MPKKKLLFFVSTISFLVFILFSYLVAKESFTQIDFDTTVKLQDRISRSWDLPFSILSIVGSAEVTLLIWGVIALLCLLKKYFKTLFLLPLFFISTGIEIFGKVLVEHPGPPFLFYRGVLDFNFPSHYVQTHYSYPSGHMTRTAFLASFSISYLILKASRGSKPILISILLAFILLMIVSRVYLGEHWLSDVIGGLLLGSSFGIIPALFVPLEKRT